MDEAILKNIDQYFDFNYREFLNPNKDDVLKQRFPTKPDYQTVKEKAEKILEISKLFEYAQNYNHIPGVHYIHPLVKLMRELLSDPDYQTRLLQNLEFLAQNEDYFPLKNKNIDNFLYISLNPLFKKIERTYPEIKKYFSEYATSVQRKIDLDSLITSLSYILEEKKLMEDIFFNHPLSNLFNFQDWLFFDKIEELSPEAFKIHFNDWTLKNSGLIESYLKIFFRLLLQIQFFTNNIKPTDIKKAISECKTLGKILMFLDPQKKHDNIDRILFYRNATFHDGVEYLNHGTSSMKYLIFENFGKKRKITVFNFILDFQKIIVFILTMNYILGHILYKKNYNDKSIFQVNFEKAKELGIQKYILESQNNIQEKKPWFIFPLLKKRRIL